MMDEEVKKNRASMSDRLRVTINVDGGSRGNPGPAGCGVVIRDADSRQVLHEAGLYLTKATNNVAEYRALLAGLEQAARLGATDVTVLSDSELLVRQMSGVYRVKNEVLLDLFEEAQVLAGKFRACSFRHLPREQNAQADGLANHAMDRRKGFVKTAGPSGDKPGRAPGDPRPPAPEQGPGPFEPRGGD
jgi:probable phosphoglycerate mutase